MTTDLPRFTDDGSEATEDAPEDTPEDTPKTPGGMRVKLGEQATRIAELEQQLDESEGQTRAATMNQAYAEIGLNPHGGVGKAVATLYDGEADGLAAFAFDEFGHEASAPQHPEAAQIALGYAQLDQVGNVSSSLVQRSRPERLAEARAAGDFETEGRLLAAQAQASMDKMHGRS